ncbi:MAG: hypothetical protein NTV21_00465 [Planctomycetota bacterium]|nr:hypothetical protein [Planctomycetota bacterium]
MFQTLTVQADTEPSRISDSADSQRRNRTTASASGKPSSSIAGVEKNSAPMRNTPASACAPSSLPWSCSIPLYKDSENTITPMARKPESTTRASRRSVRASSPRWLRRCAR